MPGKIPYGMRPLGQAVKTPPFHGGNMGSNPVGVIYHRAPWPSGKAKVCNTSITSSILVDASKPPSEKGGGFHLSVVFFLQCMLAAGGVFQ